MSGHSVSVYDALNVISLKMDLMGLCSCSRFFHVSVWRSSVEHPSLRHDPVSHKTEQFTRNTTHSCSSNIVQRFHDGSTWQHGLLCALDDHPFHEPCLHVRCHEHQLHNIKEGGARVLPWTGRLSGRCGSVVIPGKDQLIRSQWEDVSGL